MTWFILIVEIVNNFSKIVPKLYERWEKRKDLDYMDHRAKIREEKAELWQKIAEATTYEEKRKLREKYLDRFIRR